MSEKFKSRFNDPVYSSTYDNGGWSDRDKLPTGDPIGDVDEPKTDLKDALRYMIAHQNGSAYDLRMEENDWVDGYNKWKADQKKYEETMKPHLKKPEGKIFGMSKSTILEFAATVEGFHKPKCDCGIKAVYGDIPAHNHKDYCDLFKAINGNI
jgi:hypothetical protein